MSARVVRRVQYSMLGALAAIVASGLYGCAEETDPDFPLHPFVEITSGPIEGGTVFYAILIAWEGFDPDGFVEHFEYAVDPPAGFSEVEINGETATVTVETIEGQKGDPDVTRISKVVDGELISFDWVHTREFSRHFRFATPDADSSGDNGQPTGRFTGMHAVYVRAVDNEGLYSIPDKVAFTAETVAPSSKIVRPNIEGGIYNLGKRAIVGWEGTDPDGVDPEKKPARFVYKLLRLDTLDPPIPISGVTSPDILYDKGDPNWLDLPVEGSSAEFFFDVPGQYVFGIRAVDEAGAMEPFLQFGRNAFRFQAFESGGVPTITLKCVAGTFTFRRSTAPPAEIELPDHTDLECTLSCSADEYGEECNEYRWGVDIPDLDLDEHWSEWSTESVLPPMEFSNAGIHVLYVEARDAAANKTLATLILNIVEFTFDKDILYVDDSFDDLYPRDEEHDAFWRSMIDGYGGFAPGDVGEHHAHLDNDRGALYPVVPLLEDLGRYESVLWAVRGSGYNGVTALGLRSVYTHTLHAYLKAGGKLWITGTATIDAMDDYNGLCLSCRRILEPGEFPWDFMKIHSPEVRNKNWQRTAKDNLIKVTPFPDQEAHYPEMDVDPGKLNPVVLSFGVSGCDAILEPMLVHSEDGFRGVVDSLYAYGSVAVHLDDPPTDSLFEGGLTALRWHDPDPAREHGRVQWFGFPLYFFEDSQAQETFNRSMDWFREEASP